MAFPTGGDYQGQAQTQAPALRESPNINSRFYQMATVLGRLNTELEAFLCRVNPRPAQPTPNKTPSLQGAGTPSMVHVVEALENELQRLHSLISELDGIA